MRARLLWITGLTVLLSGAPAVRANPTDLGSGSAEVARVADRIDEMLAKHWAEAKVKPAPLADDAEFLRRVYLDLTGCIPSVAEARMFFDDKRPDKRQHLIEELLASQRYNNHFANLWRTLLIPEAKNDFIIGLQQGDFETWLKRQLAKNVPYDQFVRDLLTAPIQANQFELAFGGRGSPNPQGFYAAKQYKPENLAASTARLFLGTSVECAQCHNHPFADWKRDQFWEFAAFFSGMRSQQGGDILLAQPELANKRQLTIPGTDKVVEAKFLDNQSPDWKPQLTSRGALAEWVAAPANPYFSRAAVNRMWAGFFGTGLVEPVDDMVSPTSVSTYPDILDYLAKEFADHKYDQRFLMRVLVSTRAYQLTSAGAKLPDVANGEGQEEPASFTRMPLRGLTAEQLFDSVAMATGFRSSGRMDGYAELAFGGASPRAEFLSKFDNTTTRAIEMQTSILQALTLMNGKLIADATSLKKSETLAAVVDAPFLTTPGRIETLYLATLSRMPNTKELDRAVRFVGEAVRRAAATGGNEKVQETAASNAMADVFWALLNSPEFVLNH